MRTFPKHESKKETPCKKGTFRNEVPVLAGRFFLFIFKRFSEIKIASSQMSLYLLFCGINLRHVEGRNLAVWRNGCVDFEMVGFLCAVGKLNFLTC